MSDRPPLLDYLGLGPSAGAPKWSGPVMLHDSVLSIQHSIERCQTLNAVAWPEFRSTRSTNFSRMNCASQAHEKLQRPSSRLDMAG